MIGRVLKGWMPRSLYGRSILIVLVPVAAILLVVTIASIQRIYNGASRQLSEAVANEVSLILGQIEAAPDAGRAMEAALEVAAPLGIEIHAVDDAVVTQHEWIDLSGRTVIETFTNEIPGVMAVDLSTRDNFARLAVDTRFGPVVLDVPRWRLTIRNPHQFPVLIGVTAILMSVIALIYLRNQMRPIRRLAWAAEAFGKGRSVPYRPAGGTEVRSAGAAFLDMRNRIERQIEQRTMMLSGVSHDLRTPLTRMKLGLSLIEDDDEARAMRRDVEDMERMLEAFLSFARGEALEDPVRADPSEIVRDLVAHAGRSEPVHLGKITGEGSAMLRPDALRRALGNLIANAVRYGHEARVGVEITDREIRFVVEDSGPGIPINQRDFVRKAFTRMDSARNQDSGSGVGLGLAIASDIARQHGGRLILEDSADLGGLRAELHIPR